MPPISCIRPRKNGVRYCLGGSPPLLLGGVSPPSPPAPTFCALGAQADWGVPLLQSPGQGSPPLPLLACCVLGAHTVRRVPCWSLTSLGTPLPPFPACLVMGAQAARGVPCPLYSGLGAPLLPRWHAVRWESMLPFRGVPPSSVLNLCVVDARSLLEATPPLLPARILHSLLGRGSTFHLLLLELH